MVSTLYDLLEVSQTASGETIGANFKRLHATYSALAANGDENAVHRMIAIKEAFATLSDPARRQRYDGKLAERAVAVEEAPAARGRSKWLLLLLAIGICAFATRKYFAYKGQLAEQERIRLQAEQAIRLAELEAQREREARLAAAQQAQRQREAEARERMEQERAIESSRQMARDLERSWSREKQLQAMKEQQDAQAERQRLSDAQRQLAREREYLRQREAENRRNYNGVGAGGIGPGVSDATPQRSAPRR